MEAVILDFPGACLRAVVGLLNAEGGRLRLITMGEREPGQVRAELCRGILPDPSPFLTCAPEGEGAADVLEIRVLSGKEKPYFLAADGQERGVWRWPELAREPALADMDMIRVLIRRCDRSVYEERRALCQDLTHEGLRRAFARTGLPLGRPQMVALGLVNPRGLHTNLAWITSDQRTYRMELLWIEGVGPAGRVRERVSVQTCFEELFRRVEKEMESMVRRQAAMDGLPDDAPGAFSQQMGETLRQVLLQLDFEAKESVCFCLYDDRLEVRGPGGPATSVACSGLRLGESACRNKRLMRVLERLSLIPDDPAGQTAFVRPPDPLTTECDGRRFRIVLSRREGWKAKEAIPDMGGSAARALALMRDKPYADKAEVANALRISQRQTCFLLNRMERDGLVECLIPNSLYRLAADIYTPVWGDFFPQTVPARKRPPKEQ